MAIITTASEPEQFELIVGSPMIATIGGGAAFDSSLSYNSLFLSSTQTQNHLLHFPSRTEVWAHTTWYTSGTRNTTSGIILLRNVAAGSRSGIKFLPTPASTSGTQNCILAINNVDLAGTNFTLGSDALYEIDLHYKIDAVVGVLEVFVDGTLRASFTGDTTMPGVGVDALQFFVPSGYYAAYISQVFVDDAVSTIGKKLSTHRPNGAGTYTEWTGSYLDVDEIALDVNTFVFTETANARFTTNYANFAAAYAGYSVDSVDIFSVLRTAPSSVITDVQHMVRENATDHTTANLGVVKNNSLQYKSSRFLVNPVTNLPWTRLEFDGAEFGVKAI